MGAVADSATALLAGELAETFDLGRIVAPIVAVDSGAMGRVWRFATESGGWALKELFPWADAENAERAFQLQSAAATAGIPIALPIRGKSGQLVESVGGGRWMASAWVDFGPPLTMAAGRGAR